MVDHCFSIDSQFPAYNSSQAEYGFYQLCPLCPHQSAYAQYLSPMQVEGYVFKGSRVCTGKVLYLQHHLICSCVLAQRKSLVHLSSHHLAYQLVYGNVLYIPCAYVLAVPHHCYLVRYLKYLLQLVGYIDNRAPFLSKLVNDFKKMLCLCHSQ